MTYYFTNNKAIGIVHFFLERVFIGVTLKELFHFVKVVKFLFRAISILLIPVEYLLISLFHPWLFVICLTHLLIMVGMARWFNFRFHYFVSGFSVLDFINICFMHVISFHLFALRLTCSLFL